MQRLPIDLASVKGFLDPEEGVALHRHAFVAAALGPCVEIGSYCGKSTVYIGAACQLRGQNLFTVDHHRGSEEMQPGWEHHDPATWDLEADAIDSLPFLRDTLRRAKLEETVIAVVGRSKTIARHWRTPISFLFIDGGHSMENASSDYESWTPHLVAEDLLAIHDVFPNPKDGGRPPYQIYRHALGSGLFDEIGAVRSLRVLKRLGD